MTNPIWAQLAEKLPWKDTPDAIALRDQQWTYVDVNSNGYASLAEIDKGLRDVIKLPALFNLKPVIIRSFTAAKTKLKAKSKYGDDYVSKAQYKYLLQYLRQYYQYWVAFDEIDTSNDRRVSANEFKFAVPLLQKWGIKINSAEAVFKQIDTNHGGYILFDQFASWAIKKNFDIDTDDNQL